MKMYGFWRSLAAYRVRAAMGLKGMKVEEIPINLLEGKQHEASYTAVNPLAVVPTLVLDDGTRIGQSMAILEYLEETHPKPALLPSDPAGRARVRGLSQIVVSDGHPLMTPRIRGYLDKEFHIDEPGREKWMVHWTRKALEAIEKLLKESPQTGKFCHGDAPTFADLCLVSHLIGVTVYLKQQPDYAPKAMSIFKTCLEVPAFANAHPMKQPGAPKA